MVPILSPCLVLICWRLCWRCWLHKVDLVSCSSWVMLEHPGHPNSSLMLLARPLRQILLLVNLKCVCDDWHYCIIYLVFLTSSHIFSFCTFPHSHSGPSMPILDCSVTQTRLGPMALLPLQVLLSSITPGVCFTLYTEYTAGFAHFHRSLPCS